MAEIFNDIFLGTVVPLLLISSGIFFGFYLKWFHIFEPIKTVRKAFAKSGKGALSGLFLALAGTLGVGNVVGVASALSIGGYGSIFWMWVSAFFAMILKYAEIVLAMTHRKKKKDGGFDGGAPYYILDCYKSMKKPIVAKILSVSFAILTSLVALAMGSMIQVGAVSDALHYEFGAPNIAVSVILAALVSFIILSGKSGLVSLTDKLVPIMTVGYLILSVSAIAIRAERIPEAFSLIFGGAFTPSAALGGVLGFINVRALRLGTMRGLLSNEAGCGTSPMAHAMSKGKVAGAQGVFGMIEVFVDTIVLCTLTALVIIMSDVALSGENFMAITIGAYGNILGEVARKFMAIAVLLFGFATVICWSHYGSLGVGFVSNKKITVNLYSVAYVLSIVIGGVLSADLVWFLSDMAIGIMTVINIFTLIFMRKQIKEESEIFLR